MLKKARKRSKSMSSDPAATSATTSAAAVPWPVPPGCSAAMAAPTSCRLNLPSPLESKCLRHTPGPLVRCDPFQIRFHTSALPLNMRPVNARRQR